MHEISQLIQSMRRPTPLNQCNSFSEFGVLGFGSLINGTSGSASRTAKLRNSGLPISDGTKRFEARATLQSAVEELELLREHLYKLNAPFEAKSRKLKSLRKEPDKARITLLSFFQPARDRIRSDSLGHVSKCVSVLEAEAWRSPVCRAQDGSERVLRFRLEVR